MARKKLIDAIIKNDPFLHKSDYFKMGDTQLWAEMSVFSEIYFINESLACYRITTESATQSREIKNILNFWISAYEMRLYLIEKYKLPTAIKNQYQNLFCRKSLQLAFIENNKKLAVDIKCRYPNISFVNFILYLSVKYSLLHVIAKFLLPMTKKYTK